MTDLEVTRKALTAETAPVLARASVIITDEAGYAVADVQLKAVREARKKVKERLAKLTEPIREAYKKIKEGLDEASALLHEIDDPLEERELDIRDSMKTYKLEEQRRINEEALRVEQEALRIQREIAAKAQAEVEAKTAPMRARIAASRLKLEEQSAAALSKPIPAPVKAANSGTRTIRKYKVVDFDKLLQAAADPNSTVPSDIFVLNAVVVNQLHKVSPAEVESWPGIEGYDDISIVGGRS